ncbi:MAG TPA: FAD-binding oxidoreductase [Candidatus Limnocylindria bacterium]|nr:FAD-binding oxidoreductase [Candidatus Limnocylindria bacterium]
MHADVAVVGGGLTGVSAAWHLAERTPGLGIVLLEARRLGNGASGRNGGQVLHWINGVSTADPVLARRVYDVTGRGIDLAERLAAAHAPGAFCRRGCLEVYTDARRAEQAAARVERLSAAGMPFRYVERAALGIAGVHGAVLDPAAGRLNALALLEGMRPALLARGVVLHEHTPVLRIHEGRTIRVVTAGGEVRARALVLATNGYTPRLGYFRRRLLPLQSHALAMGPLAPEVWRAIGWEDWDGFTDDLDRIAYAARTPGGRLVFGGGSNAAYTYRFGGAPSFPAQRLDPAVAAMRRTLVTYFPALAAQPVTHRWSGTLGITLDRVCTMGVRGADRNVYYALGYSGHGLALSLLAGEVLADLYAGNHEPWRDLPFYQRRLLPMPPEPLRWLGYQTYTRLTGRSPRRQA